MNKTAQPPWKNVAFAATLIFFIAMLACFERGWHAPGVGVLAPLFAVAVLLGVCTCLARARARARSQKVDMSGEEGKEDDESILAITSTTHTTYALAAILGVLTSMGSGVLLGLMMGQWQELFLASLIGSIYMASWPLQVLAAHVAIERRMSIGIDGVSIGGALTTWRKKRAIPFYAIRAVTTNAKDASITIELKDGTSIRHRCTSLEMARDVVERISARLAKGGTAATISVARDGRTLEAWRSQLLSPDYREREITRDDAARILSSGAATADERVGAALILAKKTDDDRARIRVAAAACVDRKLRVALERVAEDTLDDEMLDSLIGKTKLDAAG